MANGVGGRSGRGALFSSFGCAVLAGACTVTMYQGPKRPRGETAQIVSAGPSVESIDGMALPVGSTFMVLPGVHALSAKSNDPANADLDAVTICFDVRPGGSYLVTSDSGTGRWLPAIVDGSGSTIRTREMAPHGSCMEQTIRAAPADSPPAGTGLVEEEVPQPRARAAARAIAVDDDAPAAARPRATPAIDNDAPRYVRSRGFASPLPPPPRLRHPGSGLLFEMGAFFGGDNLVTAKFSDGSTRKLTAGTGIGFTVGGMWTPLWIGDGAGFGVGAYAGWKYDSLDASNASISFSRFPVGLTAHAVLRMDTRWWLLARGGIQKELDVGLSGSGDAQGSLDLTGELGGLGEGGIYYIFQAGDDHAATSFTFRYTAIRDSIAGTSLSASSFGVVWSFFYDP